MDVLRSFSLEHVPFQWKIRVARDYWTWYAVEARSESLSKTGAKDIENEKERKRVDGVSYW